MASLYQIWYEEKHKPKLFPFSIPYKNEGLTIYFENAIIKDLVSKADCEKIGVCSWKLSEKLGQRVGIRGALTQEILNSPYDVLSFTKNSKKHQMLAMANQWHPQFMPTIKLLWSKLGYKMPEEAKQPVYQNHFCARTDIYKHYVNEFLAPAIELTEKDVEMREKMIQPSGYGTLSRDCDLKSVKAKLGMPDYPIAPFILERCPALWFTMHRINVTYL